MASRTKPASRAPIPADAPATPLFATFHALYDLRDVEAALGAGQRPGFTGDPVDDDGLRIRHAALQSMLDAGEGGRWRTLAHANAAAVENVRGLSVRAPHMRAVVDFVVQRLRAVKIIGVPIAMPPLLLVGPPGVGKTWLMGRLARAMGVPFRTFAMNLVTLGDTLSGSHPVWKASTPGLVAQTLLREPVANPLILVDELDKPPARHVGGDLYRPFYSLLEPESARAFVDDHFGIPIDASRVMWVASANRIEEIPAPILDRLTVVEVGSMAQEDRIAVLGSVYVDLRARYRDFFDAKPEPELLDRLAAVPPRQAKLAMDDAMTRAAADGRRSVTASDVKRPDPGPSPAPTARRIH